MSSVRAGLPGALRHAGPLFFCVLFCFYDCAGFLFYAAISQDCDARTRGVSWEFSEKWETGDSRAAELPFSTGVNLD